MNNKSGFISMTLVYTFLILFLFIMLAILSCYGEKNKFIGLINEKINNDIDSSKGKTLFSKMIEDNVVTSSSQLNLKAISSDTNGKGLYYIDDTNQRRIYFYRGNVENNYVIFGNDTSEEKSLCWRIVRTNEDGSIRLIYNGIASNNVCNNNANYITSTENNYTRFTVNNGKYNDNAYVGYTYGGAGKSTFEETHYGSNSSGLKSYSEIWFEERTDLKRYLNVMMGNMPLVSGEYRYIANSTFCADRTKNASGLGTGTNATTYGAKNRKNEDPSLNCTANDSYSLSINYGGNDSKVSALNYPIGLLSADEVRLAGANMSDANNDFYLRDTDEYGYWTMSPASFDTKANVYYVSSNGTLAEANADVYKRIRPVISIKSTSIVMSGIGSANAPYILGVN